MAKKRVVDIVEEIVAQFLTKKDIELVDIEFLKEGQHRYLRIYLDKEDGISLDDCQEVSEFLSGKLDEIDPIKESYYLEVSSPGIDRPLKRDKDFKKYAGELVEARLYHPIDSQKIIEGKLVGLQDNKIIIDRVTKGIIEIPRDKVSLVKLLVNFD